MNDDILSLIKCKCNCSGCGEICQNIVNNCILEFEYVKEGWIYRFDFTMKSEKILKMYKLGIPRRIEDMYDIRWFLGRNQTEIRTFKEADVKFHGLDSIDMMETLIDGLVCPFNIPPERIKKLLIFS